MSFDEFSKTCFSTIFVSIFAPFSFFQFSNLTPKKNRFSLMQNRFNDIFLVIRWIFENFELYRFLCRWIFALFSCIFVQLVNLLKSISTNVFIVIWRIFRNSLFTIFLLLFYDYFIGDFLCPFHFFNLQTNLKLVKKLNKNFTYHFTNFLQMKL